MHGHLERSDAEGNPQVPIRQDTLRTRWLAQQRYAETTKVTYSETLKAFQTRYGVYAEVSERLKQQRHG